MGTWELQVSEPGLVTVCLPWQVPGGGAKCGSVLPFHRLEMIRSKAQYKAAKFIMARVIPKTPYFG